jgi:hypothetical protein
MKTSDTPANQQKIVMSGTITGRFTSGTMSSGLIGPASQWNSLDVRYSESESSDETLFDIVGVRLNGEENLLKTDLADGEDLSFINAGEYPYLRILFKPTDNTFVTSPQLDHWIVTYQPVAEGLLLYRGAHEQQLVFEGQVWNGDYSFVNISNEVFPDSLDVKYEVKNHQTFATTSSLKKILAPAPGDTTRFTIPFPTFSHDGVNDVEVFVNPRIVSEVSYDNNIIALSNHLNVLSDGAAPVLDITVDGRHIVRDEFISSSPDIRVMLWDNNPYLLKKDTAGMVLLLALPCDLEECDFERIYFSSPEITWQAETDTSEFRVNFKPSVLQDGRYTLRAAGSDVKGNSSGDAPYEIVFQVKGESSLILLPAYPNPFADQTNFEFTLTGQQLPSAFGLEILTLGGKPVYRFTIADMQRFHIGTNIITWEATDIQGTPLPNGIYIYRITIQVGDQVKTELGKVALIK